MNTTQNEAESAMAEARPTQPRGRKWLFRAVAMAFAVLLPLVGGELVVRVFDIGPDIYPLLNSTYTLSDNPKLLYELVPGSVSPEDDLPINSGGMRDREYSIRKPRNTFRIAIVGDSICFGVYVKRPESFSEQLEVMLNRRAASGGPRFEVLNFALTGYNIVQIVETVRSRALKYQPDLVLYEYCLNDPEDFDFQYAALRAQLTAADKRYRDALIEGGRRLAQRSRLWLLVRHALESTTVKGRELKMDRPARSWLVNRRDHQMQWTAGLHRGEYWDRAERQLDILATVTKANKVHTELIIFPFFFDTPDYPFREIHARIAAAARQRSLGVIDLLEDFQAFARETDEPFHVDEIHPNARGHAFTAAAILRHLIERGLIPTAPKGGIPHESKTRGDE